MTDLKDQTEAVNDQFETDLDDAMGLVPAPPTPAELTQQTVKFATKREDLAKWVYSLKTSKAREEYDRGMTKVWTKIIETLELIPETARKGTQEDLGALVLALEISMAVEEQVNENFYATVTEAETELQWTLARIESAGENTPVL